MALHQLRQQNPYALTRKHHDLDWIINLARQTRIDNIHALRLCPGLYFHPFVSLSYREGHLFIAAFQLPCVPATKPSRLLPTVPSPAWRPQFASFSSILRPLVAVTVSTPRRPYAYRNVYKRQQFAPPSSCRCFLLSTFYFFCY